MLLPEGVPQEFPLADLASLDLIPDPVWIGSPDGRHGYMNAAARRCWDAAERFGSLVEFLREGLHPGDEAGAAGAWLAAVRERQSFRADFRVRGRDGSYRWVRAHAEPLLTGEACAGWAGTLTDVHGERSAAARADLLFAANALFAAVHDPRELVDALVATVAPKHADYCAIDLFAEDGSFERVAVAAPPHLRDRLLETRARYLAGGARAGTAWEVASTGEPMLVRAGEAPDDWSPLAHEVRDALGVRSSVVVPLDDGRRRIGAMSLARVDPQAPGYDDHDLPFYVDLASRAAVAIQNARITAALVASERRYHTLADELPQLIGVTRPDGSLLYVNETWCAYTGRRAEAGRTPDWTDLVHPEDLPGLVEGWERATHGAAGPFETHYRLRRHDGAYRWMLNRAVPVRDQTGAVTSWIGTATDIDERKRAEDALRVALDIGTLFAGTLDTRTALQQLADVAVRHLADWCGVYVYDEQGVLRPVAIAHADPSRVRFVHDFLRRFPLGDDDSISMVARSGRPERINEIPPEAYAAIADPERREMAQALNLRAIMNVPLAADDQCHGVLSLALAESERIFTDDDERLAAMIAQRAAIAVGNARLFERQRDVARTLQGSFLPARLPQLGGVVIDAEYIAGSLDLTIGGDWYDAFAYDDETLAFSIGDVGGHGLEAAVPMGKMRQTFRALSVIERDPACVVSIADSVLRREHPDVFVTAFVATCDLREWMLRYAIAGHPAPFVRAPGGALRRLAPANVPLGLADEDDIETHEERLHDGDLIVAFTDGLIETDRDIERGEQRVAQALAHPAFDVCSRPAALLRAMVVPPVVGDDIAILSVRVGGGAQWCIDAADGATAQAARASFVARLAAAGVPEQARLSCEVIFGEIVGNVARYTPGAVDLALGRDDGDAMVLVALDRGPGFVWQARSPDAESENGRGLFLIQALARAVRCEHVAGFGTYLRVTLDV